MKMERLVLVMDFRASSIRNCIQTTFYGRKWRATRNNSYSTKNAYLQTLINNTQQLYTSKVKQCAESQQELEKTFYFML